jgi:hypothetical protein
MTQYYLGFFLKVYYWIEYVTAPAFITALHSYMMRSLFRTMRVCSGIISVLNARSLVVSSTFFPCHTSVDFMLCLSDSVLVLVFIECMKCLS